MESEAAVENQREFHVRLFAAAKQSLGADFVLVSLSPPHTVAHLQSNLIQNYPSIAKLVQQSRIAINASYAPASQALPSDAEIALIPPVSGG